MSNIAVQIEELVFGWSANKTILTVPQFEVKTAERVFIKGPSGSGKSTFLNLLGGIVSPQQGQISLLGKGLSTYSQSQLDHFRSDHLGFIFQQFNLLPYLNLIDNVCLPCKFSKRRLAKVEQRYGTVEEAAKVLLSHLGLDVTRLSSQKVNELSTGQQQRVAVARALIGDPELIIADEPTSALDTEHRDRFIQLLCEQCDQLGATLLFVSHDPFLEPHFSRVEVLRPDEEGGFRL